VVVIAVLTSEYSEHASESDDGPEHAALMIESRPIVVMVQVTDSSFVFAREHSAERVTANPSSVVDASEP